MKISLKHRFRMWWCGYARRNWPEVATVPVAHTRAAYRAGFIAGALNNTDFALRSRLASMSETIMRCVLELEQTGECSGHATEHIREQCAKLRAAVLAAT